MQGMSMKEKMARIAALPSGEVSPSGHYWCATCKKFFRMEEPTCPYMTGMCINQAIPVESVPPPHPIAYERFGLFYPKFPQRALAWLVDGVAPEQRAELGAALADAYLEELTEWRVQYRQNPVETLKSFVVFLSGCEVSQRRLADRLLFIVLDPDRVWPNREALREVGEAALEHLRREVDFPHPAQIDFVEIVPGPLGRYFCPKCRMYFEFGKARERVICPLMPQKCMFEPTAVSGTYPLADLLKIYRITPGLYGRLMRTARRFSRASLGDVVAALDEEVRGWGFEGTEEEWAALYGLLGLA
ncbi:MAG TPA: hypothetical protein ENK08_09980 [Chloroflexi bacterium]|nr:hypothetical protein [Chloroflexota bacterium]